MRLRRINRLKGNIRGEENGKRTTKEKVKKEGMNYGKEEISEREGDRVRSRKEVRRLQNQQVSSSSSERLLHILQLCNPRKTGWASNQMRGNLLFLR